MTVLHLDSSARLEGSNTRILGQYLVENLADPVIYRDLASQPLPPISAEDLIAVHGSLDSKSETFKKHLDLSGQLIEELNQADTLVIGAPMYNFGIPAVLKQWIDAVCRAGVSFKYSAQGPEGLLGVKRAYIITGAGGTPIGGEMDFASRYLEHICHFLGIEDVFHIHASGSKRSPEQVITQGKLQIDALLTNTTSNDLSGAV